LTNLIIETDIVPGFDFKSYQDLIDYTGPFKYEVGNIFEIAGVNCKILEILKKNLFKIEVKTICPAKFAESLYDIASKYNLLALNFSDITGFKKDFNFHASRSNFYISIIDKLVIKYNLVICTNCDGYFELNNNFFYVNNNYLCSLNCLSEFKKMNKSLYNIF